MVLSPVLHVDRIGTSGQYCRAKLPVVVALVEEVLVAVVALRIVVKDDVSGVIDNDEAEARRKDRIDRLNHRSGHGHDAVPAILGRHVRRENRFRLSVVEE